MEITLIRHAEAAAVEDATFSNRSNRSNRSIADPPLTARGERQAALLAERATRWKRPTGMFVSPALRARQTAEPLCASLGANATEATWLAEVEVEGGRSVDAARAVEHIGQDTLDALRARVTSGIVATLAEAGAVPAVAPGSGPGQGRTPRRWHIGNADAKLVLVGHGMAHAVLLDCLLGLESVPWSGLRFQFGHAAFARVRAFALHDAWVFGLVRYNVTEHLPAELRTY
jgi:broad specificity phosphatase PhoE